jgi:hypothetical protein
MESVAHALVYDCMISDTTTSTLLETVRVPILVLDSAGSTDELVGWAAIVASPLPLGDHRSLQGQWHGGPDETLGPALVESFRGWPMAT